MPNNFTDEAEKLILDWMFTTGAVTRPPAWYVALFTAAGTDAAAGTEVAVTGYARQPVTFAAATSGPGSTGNTAEVKFTAGADPFGTIVAVAIFDALTGGRRLMYAPLTDTQQVKAYGSLSFPVTQGLPISLD